MFTHKQQHLKGFSLTAFLTRMNACWFNGRMSAAQRDSMTAFVAAWLFYTRILGRDVPVSWLAYVLATAYHETAATMQPIAEYGHGSGRPYGEPDPATGQVYYGRGYVQLTWRDNYERAQTVVINTETLQPDIPFLLNADLAMKPIYAAQIAISGMTEGWFTGKKLSDYLTDTQTDYVNARRIINGTDKAQTIAAYAIEVEDALHLAHGDGIARSVVRDGSSGDDVRELQLMLALSPDGISGPDTVNAVMLFQAANLLQVDGVCGEDTWAALDREVYDL